MVSSHLFTRVAQMVPLHHGKVSGRVGAALKGGFMPTRWWERRASKGKETAMTVLEIRDLATRNVKNLEKAIYEKYREARPEPANESTSSRNKDAE